MLFCYLLIFDGLLQDVNVGSMEEQVFDNLELSEVYLSLLQI